ncbi:MAG: MoaD/ThiS family protein [Bacillota bacterium]
MTITVKVMGPLIKIVGKSTITVSLPSEATLRMLLDHLFECYGDELKNEVLNEDRTDLAPYYKLLVDGRNSKLMAYLDTKLQEGQLVHVMPPIAGG